MNSPTIIVLESISPFQSNDVYVFRWSYLGAYIFISARYLFAEFILLSYKMTFVSSYIFNLMSVLSDDYSYLYSILVSFSMIHLFHPSLLVYVCLYKWSKFPIDSKQLSHVSKNLSIGLVNLIFTVKLLLIGMNILLLFCWLNFLVLSISFIDFC